MAYWICVVSTENWTIVKSRRIWGVSECWRNVISHVRVGDILVFYVVPKSLGGIFEVVSNPYYDNSGIFYSFKSKDEKYPYRVKLRPILVFKEPIDFTPLIPKLSFTKDMQRWSTPFRRTMFKISKKDFNIIKNYLEKVTR